MAFFEGHSRKVGSSKSEPFQGRRKHLLPQLLRRGGGVFKKQQAYERRSALHAPATVVAKHVLIKDFDLASVQKALRRPDAFSVGGLL